MSVSHFLVINSSEENSFNYPNLKKARWNLEDPALNIIKGGEKISALHYRSLILDQVCSCTIYEMSIVSRTVGREKGEREM